MPSTSLPARDELPTEFTWDLTPLYTDDAAWEREFAATEGCEQPLLALQGKLGDSAANLAECFRLQDELERRLETLYVYAHLRADEDTANNTCQGRQDRARSRFIGLSATLAWIEPEILALSAGRLAELSAAPEMAPYQRALQMLLRNRPHTLSASEERLLSLAAEPLGTPQKTFGLLNNADLRFPNIEKADGEQVELTQGNYIRFLEDRDRDVRRRAFEGMYDTYGALRNTLASLLDGNVRKQVFSARVRNFPSALRASLHQDQVDQAVYDGLIEAVHRSFPVFFRYVDLRRRQLGLDKLDMYDHYVPIVPDFDVEVEWQQACEWCQQAMAPLGDDYCRELSRAFGERWIDVYECRGKRSGAYSSGCYDSNPYVLMNYQGNLDSVFTLAHELGHSLHSLHSNRAQPHLYAGYRIFVAEVASTTNELLLLDYLRRTQSDPRFQASLLNNLCDHFKGTLFRQTMFAEFEKMVHAFVEAGEPLTPEKLCGSYYELNAAYYGEGVQPDQRIEMEWARIPHFYYNFYVYKYATSFAASQVFAQRLLSGDQQAREDYLGFLRAGCSKDPLDILADAGVDLRDPAVITGAMDVFDQAITDLDALLA